MIAPLVSRRQNLSRLAKTAARRRAILAVERCEPRTLMATMLGVDVANNLIRFTSTAPGTVVSSKPITGLANASGETIAGFDYRPINTTLYAVTSDTANVGRLYTIDIATGAATLKSVLAADPADVTAPDAGLSGTSFGVDFNPVADRLRVVSNTGQNFRINVSTGLVTTDTTLNPGTPAVTGVAYTNNLPGAISTTLYDIDTTADTLSIQSPPNNGTLVSVGSLGVDASAVVGFDIQTVGVTNTAYASLVVGGTTGLYQINLVTGAATLIGAEGAAIRALAITPDAYTAALVGTTATFTGTAAGAAITIDTAGGLVRHNRFSQGDSGFNSDFDFDSTVPGDQTISVSSPTASVLINALGGNDTATIEFSGGNPTPGGGIDFDGGTGLNTLILQRSSGVYSATSETHTATGPGAGTILIDGRTVTFSNLAPVIDTVPAVDFTFTPPLGSQTINIVDGDLVGTTQTTRIISGEAPAAFEQVDFANKQFVAVFGSLFEDQFMLDNPATAAGLVELDIFARAGNDSVFVVGNTLSASVAYVLDGGSGIDTLTLDAGFTTATLGAGNIQLSSGAQLNFSNFEIVNIANVASPTPVIQPPAITFDAVEGTEFVDRTVAIFSTGRLGAKASDFGATITWGDSIISAGTVTQDASIPSLFYVTGSHLYIDNGAFDITTAIVDTGGTATVVNGGTTTTITYGFSGTATTVTTARVADALISATGVSITTTEGAAFSGLVATFTTADANPTAGDYTASIAWGDGTTSAGTITATGSPAGVTFRVNGTHTYATDGTYAVVTTITSAGGSVAVATGQAIAGDVLTSDSPAQALSATVGTPIIPSVVALFTDGGTSKDVSQYDATIDWGDGSPLQAGLIRSIIELPSGRASYSVIASHAFTSNGTFNGRVTVHASDGTTISIPFTTTVASPNLALVPFGSFIVATPGTGGFLIGQLAISPLPTVSEGQTLTNIGVAGISAPAGSPALAPNFYTAIVDFGDGTSPVIGLIDSDGIVRASHTFQESGKYTMRVTIGTTGNPNVVTASLAQVVSDIPIILRGVLAQTSDTGQSRTDGITNDSTPTFQGTSEPGSIVTVYVGALVNGVPGAPAKIADAVTDAAGSWRATTLQPLSDGAYAVLFTAIDDNNVTTASLSLPQTLVIDTVGPRVTNVAFDRKEGRVGSTLQDERSGLDQSTLIDGSNYRFSGKSLVKGYVNPPRFLVTSLSVSSAASATSAQNVIAAVNFGRVIRGGRYAFTIFSGLATDNRGIRDVAGNALDGEYYGYLPSGNLKNGGDFVAGLNAIHDTIFVPRPIQDGFASPLNPPGTRGTIRNVNNPGIQALLGGRVKTAKHAHPVGPRAV